MGTLWCGSHESEPEDVHYVAGILICFVNQVVFLWNDPVPLEPTAQARRLFLLHNGDIGTCILDTDENTLHTSLLGSGGLFVQGLCRPMFATLTPARGQVVFSPFTLNVICLLSYTSSLHLKVFEKIRENFKYANSSGVDQQVWSCFENENVEMCYDDAKF